MAYDPGSGELRTHYAGFFDPGFGYGHSEQRGTKAVLEVRPHDVPFLVEDGQLFCKLRLEHTLGIPQRLLWLRPAVALSVPSLDPQQAVSALGSVAGNNRRAAVVLTTRKRAR